jgi:hypothetical protein
MAKPTLLIVPGWGNSGLALLQSLTDEPATLAAGRQNFEPLATL